MTVSLPCGCETDVSHTSGDRLVFPSGCPHGRRWVVRALPPPPEAVTYVVDPTGPP